MPLPMRRNDGVGPARPVVGFCAPAALWLLALGAAGCTPAQYAHQADRAAYALIREKQQLALGRQDGFDIAYRPFRPGVAEPANPEGMLRGKHIPTAPAEPILPLGDWLEVIRGRPLLRPTAWRRALSLAECLEVAFRNSRSFQNRKEELYVSALALANARHDWSLVSGDVSALAETSRTGGDSTHSGSGEANLSFAQKFATGGAVTLAAGLDAATDFLGIRSTTFGSLLEANLTQPLLRGAWRGLAYESLYRQERDFAYAILEYERFTQTFAVDIAVRYYDVLQRRDELQNELENLSRLQRQAGFDQARAEAGMVSRVQADQAAQNVLSAEARVAGARQRYRNTVDEFKVSLGLPIAAAVEPDPRELENLQPLPIPFDESQAIQVALRTRPDVLTSRADVRDARRDVEIAGDDFNPRLDVALGISAPGTEPRKPFRTRFHRNTRSASVEFDYELDQTDHRDAYRGALIRLERAQRDLEQFLDNVRLQVRRSYRALEQSRRTYEIQKEAVTLAGRRTRLAELEQREGLASTRDVLEAQDALRSSRIALTAALVSYATTRLDFLAGLGMISVDETGRIHERNEPFYFDRLQPETR